MAHKDPHSCWTFGSAQITHIDFDLTADFKTRTLSGSAVYRFSKPLENSLELDTRIIDVKGVFSGDGTSRKLEWSLGDETYLGRVLTIRRTENLTALRIEFATSPESAALQWLDPEQTAGKRHPYMYSQCQAILARSVFPCQDTPAVRFTYSVTLRVPADLTAVMAADRIEVKHEDGFTVCRFKMRHPIPSYLFALAIGNITSEKIGSCSSVFAEPEMVQAAAWEFSEVDAMIEGAEAVFGEYIWDNFNLLVMPPSFPYGGMENPTLTFLTPTLMAGDRSLVAVVAHELAHSWTGNLVTNATWEDFWLNEGWTVYAERRILERLYGIEFTHLQAVSGRNDLRAAFKNFGEDSPYTKLKTDLTGIDPDEVFSSVPYEKGFLFIVAVERAVGREAFDGFIRSYIRNFKFSSITTSQFVEYLTKQLPDAAKKVDLNRWIHEPGLPDSAPEFASGMIDDVRNVRVRWDQGERDLRAAVAHWNTHQIVLFLEELPTRLPEADCAALDNLWVAQTKNCEILLPFYCIAAGSSYRKVFPAIRDFLSTIGRGKYLKPLYRTLHENPETRALARELFEEYKDRYHSVGRLAVQRILEK